MSIHTRAENPKYDSTEWQELQKQYGNLERTNRDLLREDEEEEAKAVAKMVIEQAKERDRLVERVLERDGDADELKFETEDDERAFEEYRAKRIEEMRRCGGKSSFSGVLDIAADSFKREVTDAAGDDLFVVVHLYNDGREDCSLVDHWLRELANENHGVKFTRILFSNAIPNYPEANLPTVLVYHKHDIVWSMVTMSALAPLELLTKENGKKLFLHALTRIGALKGKRVNDGTEGKTPGGGGKLLGRPRDGSDSDQGSGDDSD